MLNLMRCIKGMCLQGGSAKGMMMKLRQEYILDSPQALHVLNHTFNDFVMTPNSVVDTSLRCINNHPVAQPFRDSEARQRWEDFQLCQGCQDRYIDGSAHGTSETTPCRPPEIIELSSTESNPALSMIAPTPTPSTITRPPATLAVSFGFAQELPGISATTPVSIPSQGWQAAPTAPTAPPPKQTAAPSGAPSGGDGGDDSDDNKKGSSDRDGSPPSKRGRSRSSTPKKERPLQSDGEQCLRTCGIHESCTESDFFAYAANHLLGRKLWRQTLDGSDGKRLLNCLSRNRNLVEQFSGEEQTVGPGEMGGNWP